MRKPQSVNAQDKVWIEHMQTLDKQWESFFKEHPDKSWRSADDNELKDYRETFLVDLAPSVCSVE